jgi:transcriptional regulator GlxA family with amidase domain
MLFTQRSSEGINHDRSQDLDGTATKIDEVVNYMVRNLNKPITVSILAALARTSPSHFFALFKRQMGRAPIEFLIHMKVQRACELLDTTDFSIKEVAASLGYDDQFYFSRVFKSVIQLAPTQYRLLTLEARQQVKTTAIANIRVTKRTASSQTEQSILLQSSQPAM